MKNLKTNIDTFLVKVGDYLHMEYSEYYYREFTRDGNLSRFYDFVGNYYLSGYSVPHTARFVVELILQDIRSGKPNK